MKNVNIISFGSYVPELSVSNNDLEKFLDTSDEWISSRTGIKSRHISENENTSDICAKAFENIIKNAGIEPENIDLLIVATISPDYLTPSTACIVLDKCGAKNAVGFDISAACSGFVYSITVAESLIKRGLFKNAVVIGGETLSKTVDWNDRGTCVLFADGAGGVLLQESENDIDAIIGTNLMSDGSRHKSLTSGHMPISNHFNSKNREINTYLEMDGKAIFDFALKQIPKNIKQVIEESNVKIEDIKYFVLHQSNLRITHAIAKKLGVDKEKFYSNIENMGNTSAASIPIALNQMFEEGKIKPGNKDKLLLCGFGAGLTWGSVIVEI